MMRNIIIAVCCISLLGVSCAPETPRQNNAARSTSPKLEGQFLHHVYFWLKQPDNASHVDSLIQGLRTLTSIKYISDYHIGLPAGTPREVVDNTYSVSWLLVFDDAISQDEYQVDSLHLEFVKNYSHLWDSVKVYDTKTTSD